MSFSSKLKADISINMLVPALFTLIGLALLWILFGRIVAWGFVAVIILLYALFSFSAYFRTRCPGYLVASLFQLFAALWVGSLHRGILYVNDAVTSLLSLAALFFLIWMQILVAMRKLNWRGRELLELAARPVEQKTDGFTERPRPLDKVPYSRDEVLVFARFASRHLLAMPYVDEERVVFVVVTMAQSFAHLYPWFRDYTADTWVAFGNDGQVAVNIARGDYLTYKDSLSFDHLCTSLGNLFVEFMEIYGRGEGVRIIDRLNALGVNPYT